MLKISNEERTSNNGFKLKKFWFNGVGKQWHGKKE